MKTKLFTLFLALITGCGIIFADGIQIGNLYYNLDAENKTAEITYKSYVYATYNEDWNISNVRIPETVTYEGIVYNVTSIGDNAFRSCKSLRWVTLPNSILRIGQFAFCYCTALTSITLSENLQAISWCCFSSCRSLRFITIPNSITHIAGYAFEDCSSLENLTIPSNVTTIASQAFYQCNNLTYVCCLATSPPTSGALMFRDVDCSQIPLYVPSESITAYKNADQWEDFQNVLPYSQCVMSSGVCGKDSDNLIWELCCEGILKISGSGEMDYIGANVAWLEYPSFIKKIIIEEGVTTISNEAFWYLPNFDSVAFPTSLRSIGESSFEGCSNLKVITIPTGVETIKWSAFQECSRLISITIPGSVTNIEEYAFNKCYDLKHVHVAWQDPISILSNVFEDVDLSNVILHVPCGFSSAYQTANVWKDFGTILEDLPLASGTCGAQGDNLTWELFCDSILTISGTGEMANYSNVSSGPWYSYNSSIQYVVIGNNVTSIGDYAFYNCVSLTSVTIPNSVTSIGEYAFGECSSLTSMTIPNSVTSIGNYAFRGCSALTSPVYNTHVFAYMPTSYSGAYTIPDGIESIAGGAFIYCTGLTSVTIPNSVTSIGDDAFRECSGLTSVTIPNSVTSIGNYAFGGCSALTSITIPNSVTSIGDYAFSYCSGLTSLICKAITPPTLGSDVFYNVDKSIPLYVPAGSVDLYKAADQWKEFDVRALLECVIASGTCGENGDNLTWELSCDSVLTISGTGAMANYSSKTAAPWSSQCAAIKTIVINTGVTSIGNYAFRNCPLTSIAMPNSITKIGNSAFYNCLNLASMVFPRYISTIGSNAFFGCSSLFSIMIPKSVTSIGTKAFANCSNLESVDVESGNTIYDNGGLYPHAPNDNNIHHNVIVETATNTLITGCKNSIIPDYVDHIGNSAFYGCTSLTTIGYEDHEGVLQAIGNEAFYNCTNLKNLTSVNAYNIRIGDRAFYNCSNLINMTPEPVGASKIGNYAFYNCKNISMEIISDTIEDWAFYNCSNLHNINLTNTRHIGEYAFYNCTGLSEVDLLSVESIGSYAFKNCTNIEAIYGFPSLDVFFKAYMNNSFETYAFANCNKLKDVYSPNGNGYDPDTEIFYDVDLSLVTVHIGCEGDARLWNEFGSIDQDLGGSFQRLSSTSDLSWIYSCDDSTLTITGEGVMPDMCDYNAPWYPIHERIKHVKIQNGITHIGSCSFQECSNLISVTIPNSVISIGGAAFYNCSSLTSITIPNSVTSIERNAFANCIGLTFIEIPYGVTNIGESAFEECSRLKSVIIPNSVTNIGNRSFAMCSSLRDVYVSWIEPLSISSYVFSDVSLTKATLHVPCSAIPVYKAANVWKEFKAYEGFDCQTFSITWKNYDGTILAIDSVQEGTMPEYNGERPVKSGTAKYSFIFKGWKPNIAEATKDTIYVAQFNQVVNRYAIKYQNYDGSVLHIDSLAYGKSIVYNGDLPSAPLAQTEDYTYIFSGWEPAVSVVVGDAVLTAQFDSISCNGRTLEFVNIDGAVLQSSPLSICETNNVKYEGPEPIACGSTRTKFVGWTPNVFEGMQNLNPAEQVLSIYDTCFSISHFTSRDWEADANIWIPLRTATGYIEGKGVQSASGNTASAISANYFSHVHSVTLRCCTNASSGEGTITVNINGESITKTIDKTGGATLREIEFDFSSSQPSGQIQIEMVGNKNSIYINSVIICSDNIYRNLLTQSGDSNYIESINTTFTNANWGGLHNLWIPMTGGQDFMGDRGIQVTGGNSAVAVSADNFGPTKIKVHYCTNASSGSGQIKISLGQWTQVVNVTSEGGSTIREAEFDLSQVTHTGQLRIEVSAAENSVYINGITVAVLDTHNIVDTHYSDIATDTIEYHAVFCEEKIRVDSLNFSHEELMTMNYMMPIEKNGVSIHYLSSASSTIRINSSDSIVCARIVADDINQINYYERPKFGQGVFNVLNDTLAIWEGSAVSLQFITHGVNIKDILLVTRNITCSNYTITCSAIIKWVNYDESILELDTLQNGVVPIYQAETPSKPATPKYTYTFQGWSPDVVAVTGDATYIAQFDSTLIEYEIHVTPEGGSTEGGTVTIDGDTNYGETMTLTPVPDGCHQFSQWSDGNTDNPRTITVTGDATYTAEFTKINYTIKGQNASSVGGSVQVVNP